MTNHVHAIVGTNKIPLQDIIRDMKKYTSKKLIELIHTNSQESRKNWMVALFEQAGQRNKNNKRYQFWQQHNQPVELNNKIIIDQKLQYIHNNPVKAGFVNRPEDYFYSSAKSYAGITGSVPVVLIE